MGHLDAAWILIMGADVWDPGLVLASALPQLLAPTTRLSVLELGAGLAVCGFVAALLGHDCISSDAEDTIASTEAAARCNEHLLHGTQWRAEVIDWDSPPPWVLERSWDVVLGGDLGWSAAREFTLVRGLDQMSLGLGRLQNCLLRLLSQLHFTEFLLAERERDLEATEDFFEALDPKHWGGEAVGTHWDLDRAGTALTSTPGLLLLNVGLVEVSFVKSLALRRKHFRTRLLMAHHDAELEAQ
eukprot:g26920.t1